MPSEGKDRNLSLHFYGRESTLALHRNAIMRTYIRRDAVDWVTFVIVEGRTPFSLSYTVP